MAGPPNMEHMKRVADAPAHMEPNKDPSDFVATNKSMRCCFVCRLVKSERQVSTACSFHSSIIHRPIPLAFWQLSVWQERVTEPHCWLLATQFIESGCDNCQFLQMDEDRTKASDA